MSFIGTFWMNTAWFAAGLAVGWVVFKRPQWAQSLIDKVKAAI